MLFELTTDELLLLRTNIDFVLRNQQTEPFTEMQKDLYEKINIEVQLRKDCYEVSAKHMKMIIEYFKSITNGKNSTF